MLLCFIITSNHDILPQKSPVEIGTINAHDQDGAVAETLTLQRGATPELIDQLIEKSKEEQIAHYCHRDKDERFVSRDTFGAWHEKDGGRTDYYLIDQNGELAGLIWYGKAELKPGIMPEGSDPVTHPHDTFAIRMYEGANGKHLARPFMTETLRDYVSQLYQTGQLDNFTGIHLETDTTNPRSVPLYHKAGYQDVHVNEETGRITMVLTPQKIQEICSAPQYD